MDVEKENRTPQVSSNQYLVEPEDVDEAQMQARKR
jgi:hypothetical protein